MTVSSLVDRARPFLKTALSHYDQNRGFGSMTCAAYDTAWVALVTKDVESQKKYLFPECFKYLLDAQLEDGSWVGGSDAQIDGILNTASPLLALTRIRRNPHQLRYDPIEIDFRIQKAVTALRTRLDCWDVSTTDHVGFEIIVPAVLRLLEKEDASYMFEFEGKSSLMKINCAKLARFKPEYLYGTKRLTALHSLESFVGQIDFDRVAHHLANGSMLGSPSSTAAYLMNASRWDDEAESYLRHVVEHAAGRGSGGVPSAFPSTHFEATWMLSTLLRGGFTAMDLASVELETLVQILESSFKKEAGVLGFAPNFEADVDDTAKAITSLTMLGIPASPQKMIEAFDAGSHFRTYAGERDPSFTANANSLLALLQQPAVSQYSSQIWNICEFLNSYWWTSDLKIKDKWNTSHLYPSLLLVEAFTDVLGLIEDGRLPAVPRMLHHKIAITLFQACFRPMLDQRLDGSWNGSVEETAYGVLILSEARRIAFFDLLRRPLADAIDRGVAYLSAATDASPCHIWIEKVSYGSPILTQSYLLAALKSASGDPEKTVGSALWRDINTSDGLDKHVKLFHQAPLFASNPAWEIRGSMIEALLFKPLLIARKANVFKRDGLESDAKYFEVIPLFWTASNNRARTYASTEFLFTMSEIALLNFQLDEFFEASAGPAFEGRIDELRQIIHRLLPDDDESLTFNTSLSDSFEATKSPPESNGHVVNGANQALDEATSHIHTNGHEPASAEKMVIERLSRFLRHVVLHPHIQKASSWERRWLKRELRSYFLAHTQQAEDATRFERPSTRTSTSAVSFFNWVRTTSSDHISCPYSFVFVSCFLSDALTAQGGDCFPSVGQKYLATALCRHLSCMCRMYNDAGSATRDLDEGNLNSIEFPEFDGLGSIEDKQRALLDLAQYERSCVADALVRLERMRQDEWISAEAARFASRRMQIWSMFCDEVDLYGQVYVVRDISARVTADRG